MSGVLGKQPFGLLRVGVRSERVLGWARGVWVRGQHGWVGGMRWQPAGESRLEALSELDHSGWLGALQGSLTLCGKVVRGRHNCAEQVRRSGSETRSRLTRVLLSAPHLTCPAGQRSW